MRRSVEILESRLSYLYRLRDVADSHMSSALRSSASPDAKVVMHRTHERWSRRWKDVHDKAWNLWLKAGGAKS